MSGAAAAAAGMTKRWIDGPTATDAEWAEVEGMLASRGWMSLNRATSRVLVAEAHGRIMGFHVFQLVPMAGPLYVIPALRGTGLAGELADDMLTFLVDAEARGWLVVVDSPHAGKLCQERGMTRITQPVYVMVEPGGVEV